MGNESSTPKEIERGSQSSSAQSGSSSGWQHDYAQSSFSQYARNYPMQQPHPAGYPPLDPQHASHNYGPPAGYPPLDPQYPSHNYGPPPGYPTADPQYPSHNYGIPESNMPTQHGGPSEPNIPTQYGVPQSQTHASAPQKKFDRRYSRIADNYNSLEEVSEALARAGLESSNLIVGIDYTKSNEWTGKHSYNGQSLHHIGAGLNPYEQAISIIGKTLAVFDDDNLIPCYGFGDVSTHDQDVFSFYPDGRHCKGFEEVLRRYRELTPNLKLAGPTSFAPIIEMAMTVVQQSRGQYHVLLILADGQVTRSVDTEYGQLSPQEQKTVQAIVEASKLPLSIILVGVGDGPWDTMKEFDDNIPAREFDNFQFVNFTEIMIKQVPHGRKEREFALTALMEIPSQYKATLELNLLGAPKQKVRERVALPPPVHGGTFSFGPEYPSPVTRGHGVSPYNENKFPLSAAPSAPLAPSAPIPTYEPEELQHRICPICLSNPMDMAFGCGHQTCCDCGRELQLCPICRSRIETRIKLYQ